MYVSVYIPANNTQLLKLESIIDIYNSGSVVPDQIVVSVVGVENEENLNILKNIFAKGYKNVYIYAGRMYKSESENRKGAIKLTSGDVVVYHDPMKFPHSRRIESIVSHFDQYDVSVIHHTFVYNGDITSDVCFDPTITTDMLCSRYFPFNNKLDCWRFTRTYGQEFSIDNVDMSSVAVKREILQNVLWKDPHQYELYRGSGDGHLYEFAMETLYTYRRSMLLGTPLTIVNKNN